VNKERTIRAEEGAPASRKRRDPSRSLALLGVSLFACLLGATPAHALSPLPASANAVQDFVFLGDTRPVLVRLQVQIDGQPFEAAWTDFMRQWFDYFDVNGDGLLSKAEVERAPQPQILYFMAQGSIGGFGGQNNTLKFDQVTKSKNGTVSRQEFADYYRKNGFGPVQFAHGPDMGTSDRLTDALFLHLDKDKDGKLSKEEVAVAAAALHKLDLDEDEMITAAELAPGLFGFNVNFGYRGPTRMTALDSASFLTIVPGEALGRVVEQIMGRYDKDKNHKLSREEIGLDAATFDRLDANKDGQLEVGELEKWLRGPADLELIVRLGALVPSKRQANLLGQIASQLGKTVVPALDVVSPKDKSSPFAKAVRAEGGNLLITLGDAQIELNHTDNTRMAFGGNKQFYLQQFKTAAGAKAYLEKAEGMGSPYFRGLFDFADRDGDGKLHEKELIAFLDLQNKGSASFATLTLTDYGRGLFELFDANGDGRLGLRELRTAWTRLAPYDREGKGAISRTDIPRRFQLMVSQGNTFFASRFNNFNPRPNQSVMQTVFGGKAGPLWFRKMDRNGDGDVSPQEFLGSPEDFERIDTDHDGLIDATEAAKADEWFRKKLEAKGK
jgi:Ca2+-binding EF-hand superfamily protein